MSSPKPTFSPKPAAHEKFQPQSPRPFLLSAAIWGLVVGVVLLVLASIIASLLQPIDGSLGLQLVSMVILFGPPIVLASFARRGERWARILLSLGMLWLLVTSVVVAIIESQMDLWDIIFSVVFALFTIAIVVLFWLPSSGAYFRAVAEEKRQFKERQLL